MHKNAKNELLINNNVSSFSVEEWLKYLDRILILCLNSLNRHCELWFIGPKYASFAISDDFLLLAIYSTFEYQNAVDILMYILWPAITYEPPHDKTNKMACAPSEDSDQPGHPPSLIRVLAVRMNKPWVLSYPLSAQRRLWSDWADAQADLSLRWVHNHIVGFVMRRLIFHCRHGFGVLLCSTKADPEILKRGCTKFSGPELPYSGFESSIITPVWKFVLHSGVQPCIRPYAAWCSIYCFG